MDFGPQEFVPASPGLSNRRAGAADLHLAVPLASANSFAWVVSHLAVAAEDLGLAVSLPAGPLDKTIPAPMRSRLMRMMERPASARAQIKWAHYWPAHWNQELNGEINAEIFCGNYRYGPRQLTQLDQWMRHTVLNAYRKLPVSQYCLDDLTALGVPPPRSRLLPLGYSPEVANDTGANDQYRQSGFVFLALTNSHDSYRYGTDILLSAFARAFAGRRDVTLVLKDYGDSLTSDLRGWLRLMPEDLQIVHITDFLPKDDLIRLYRGADAFVAPFRGEGFGMKIIDAAALGLPVLAPLYGGPADFLHPDSCIPLKFHEVPVGPCLDRLGTMVPAFARWAEVDASDLAARMLDVVEHRDQARDAAMADRNRILKNFSWTAAAATLAASLEDFQSEREHTIRARPAVAAPAKRISVIIPTLNRPDALTRTLSAYAKQTSARDNWEILISDDGSGYDVAGHVARFRDQIDLHVFTEPVRSGAGTARNRVIAKSRGELVLFTGDDIEPAPDFLTHHLAAHRRFADPNVAVLGRTDWHADLRQTRLMRHITGPGAHQFGYDYLTPETFADHGYFYTSNVSLPRGMMMRHEEWFSAKLNGYGYEDIELGLRLALGGMRLFYRPEALGAHWHDMSDTDIFRRQYEVGRSLATFAMLHPARIGDQDRTTLRWLETFQHGLRDQADFAAAADHVPAALESMTRMAEHMASDARPLASAPDWSSGMLRDHAADGARVLARLDSARLELAQNDGLADAWFGVAPGAPNPARDFLRTHLFQRDWCPRPPVAPLVHGGPPPGGREALRRAWSLARRMRHSPWVRPWWDVCLRAPGVPVVYGAGLRLLRRLS